MGLLSSAGDAAKGVTDKATDNFAGSMIDAVAGGLTGQAGAGASGTAHYLAGEPLDPRLSQPPSIAAQPEPVGSDPGTAAKPGSNVPIGARRPTQFVHLSFAHDDHVDRFPGEAPAHGIAMRDALIREDVLVYSFARAAQRVLEQAKASKGAAGAMLETAGSLLGGSTQASGGPEAITPVLDAIRAAADPVNVDAPGYPEVHAAGVKLAESWATLHETCKTALDPQAGGGMGLPSIPGLSGLAGGAGIPEIVAMIPEWLFKVQDTYQAMFRAARQAYEWEIMKACHGYSVLAIGEQRTPSYDIWFLRDQAQQTGEGEKDERTGAEKTLESAQEGLRGLPLIGGSEPVDGVADALGSVQTAIRKARKSKDTAVDTASDKAGDVTGWLGTAESEQANMPAGSADALAKAMAALAGAPQAQPPIPALGPLMAKAMGEALLGAGKPLPGFMQTGVGIVGDIALVLLPKIYSHLHGRLGVPSRALLLAACHDAIADKVVAMVWGWIFGKESQPGRNDKQAMRKTGTDLAEGIGEGDFGTSGLPGLQEGKNKIADLVRGFLRDNVHHIDFLIEFVADDLYKELAAAKADCDGRACLTMEAYLGRLPMLAALLMRNLTFPVFNLLLKIFGLADKFAGMAWDPVNEKIQQAGAIAREVKDTKDDIRQAGEDIAAGSKRAEDNIEQQRSDIQQQASDLGQFGDTVNSLDDFDRIRKEKEGQKDRLEDTVTDAPGEIIDAAKGEEKDAGGPQQDQPAGTGPISSPRVRGGKARPVAPGEIDQAGRVTPEAEADVLKARNAPAAKPAVPAAPAMPGLPF